MSSSEQPPNGQRPLSRERSHRWRLLFGLAAATVSCQVYDENLLVDAELEDDSPLSVPGPDGDDAPGASEPSAAPSVAIDAPSPSGDAAAADPLKNGLELDDEPAASAEPTTPSDSNPTPAPSSGGAGGGGGTSATSTTGAGSQGGSGGDAGEPFEAPMGGAGGAVMSTGGSTSSGGTTSTGGSASSGGAGSTGGASAGGTGGGGAAALDSATWSFASDIDGWVLGVSAPTSLAGQSSLSFSDSQGSPSRGALEVSAPFTGPRQMIAVQAPIAPIDLRGVTISAVVLLERGLSSDAGNPSRIKLFAKSGAAYLFASGPDVTLQAGSAWVNVVFDVDSPSYVDPSGSFDPSDVREVGFEINSGTGASVSDAIIYIDSVDY